jgi:hypothetical protein
MRLLDRFRNFVVDDEFISTAVPRDALLRAYGFAAWCDQLRSSLAADRPTVLLGWVLRVLSGTFVMKQALARRSKEEASTRS